MDSFALSDRPGRQGQTRHCGCGQSRRCDTLTNCNTIITIYEGNVGLASHNSGEQGDFFKNLKKIKIGSEIFYQTNYGTKRYVVTVKEIIDEENWSYLQPTEDNRITLITCVAGQREKRLCVQAVESSEGMDYGQ